VTLSLPSTGERMARKFLVGSITQFSANISPIYFNVPKTGTQSRYTVIESNGISLLRIEPVRAGRDDAPYECIAENGVGDAVSAEATLTVYETDKTPSGFPAIEVRKRRYDTSSTDAFIRIFFQFAS
jgi:hypothetical protein